MIRLCRAQHLHCWAGPLDETGRRLASRLHEARSAQEGHHLGTQPLCAPLPEEAALCKECCKDRGGLSLQVMSGWGLLGGYRAGLTI